MKMALVAVSDDKRLKSSEVVSFLSLKKFRYLTDYMHFVDKTESLMSALTR